MLNEIMLGPTLPPILQTTSLAAADVATGHATVAESDFLAKTAAVRGDAR
jgi:hypothetical protein